MLGTFFLACKRKCKRAEGSVALRSSLACLVEGRPESGPSELSWGQHSTFSCISCRPSPWVAAGKRQAPQGSGRQRPSFSVPRLRRGVHRPAAAALRSGSRCWGGGQGSSPAAAVAGHSPALMGLGVMLQASSRGCAASSSFSAESGGLAFQLSNPPVDGLAWCRSITPQSLCPPRRTFVLVE